MTDPRSPRSPGSPKPPNEAPPGRQERTSVPDQPAPRLRPPLPTLVELGQVSATETLRPPGAVPPPPRAVPPQGRGAVTRPMPAVTLPSVEPERAEGTRAEPARDSAPATTPVLRAPAEHELIPRTERHLPDEPALEPLLPGPLDAPRAPRFSTHEAAPPDAPAMPARPPSTSTQPHPAGPHGGVPRRLLTLGAAGLASALLLFVGWRAFESDSAAETVDAGATEDPSPAPRPVLPCRSAGQPRKLASSVYLAVPLAAQTHGQGRIALAYAATDTDAVGLTLDPETLDAAQAFAEPGKGKLLAVVPRTGGTPGDAFATARSNAGLLGGGLVELPQGLAELGATAQGLQVRIGGSKHIAWPEAAATQVTSPRAEALGPAGALLTWRRGGQKGEILVGQLDAEGRPTGPASEVTSSAEEFGTPSLGVGQQEVLVSFASRASAQAPWRIELARAPAGQLPAASRPFVPEGLSESANTISPAASALPGGGWLLQWTQGEGGQHRVWLQTLDADLKPVGAVIAAGPSDKEAGQGTPWVGPNGRAASFYIVRADQEWELWGTALECPR